MKDLSISLMFLFFLSMFNCNKDLSDKIFPEDMKQLDNLFYAYDFTMESMSCKQRIEFLDSLGYQGVLLPLNSVVLKEYIDAIDIVNKDFKIPSVYYHHQMDVSGAEQRWKRHVEQVVGKNIDLLLIVNTQSGEEVPRAELEQFFRNITNYAAERDVNIVIYPHHGTLIECAADALPYVKAIDNNNLNLSFHLCHELLVGNGERMNKAVAEVAPYIKHASICGADLKKDVKEYKIWGDLIKPLYKGNYDTSIFLSALIKNNYTGPIALHTFGLKEPVDEHYKKSMDAWKKISNDVAVSVKVIKPDNSEFIIYPNPASGETTFSFQSDSSDGIVLSIINLTGQVVLQKKIDDFIQNEKQIKLNLSNLGNGIYTAKLRINDSKQINQKFWVNHKN